MSLWKRAGHRRGPDLRAGRSAARKAMSLDARLAKALLELGILLSEQRRWREAIQELRRPSRSSPIWRRPTTGWRRRTSAPGRQRWPTKELAMFERLKAREPAGAAPPMPE